VGFPHGPAPQLEGLQGGQCHDHNDYGSRAGAEPRPLFPALGQYYGLASDLAYVIVRVTAGLMLIPHGWPKVFTRGAAAVAAGLANQGIPLALPGAYMIMFLETIGGILIAIGLFTRPIAALLVIEFLVIIFVAHWPRGYAVGGGGIEFPLMWGLILLAILLRGGGPWSVDRKLGWEV
jgi:putative oxidoreductase